MFNNHPDHSETTSRTCKFPNCDFIQFGCSICDNALLINVMQEHEKSEHNLDPSKSGEQRLWEAIMDKHPEIRDA